MEKGYIFRLDLYDSERLDILVSVKIKTERKCTKEMQITCPEMSKGVMRIISKCIVDAGDSSYYYS